MMTRLRYLLLPPLLMLFLGCVPAREFGRGFGEEGVRQGADLAADAVEKRLGDDFAELKKGLRDVPTTVPMSGPDQTVWYGIGALVAYIVGSIGKGLVRTKLAKKADGA